MPREAHFEGRLLHDAACQLWLDAFIDRWLDPPARAAALRGNGRGAQRRAMLKASTR
jgi:hypothetical protein